MRKFLTWVVFVFCAILVSAWALYGIWDFDLAMANKANSAGSFPINPSAKSDICGDVNDDFIVDLGDILFLISYLGYGGIPPLCTPNASCGDVNGDGWVDCGDVLYLRTYLYGGGSAPIGSPGMCTSPYPDTSDLDTGIRDSLRVVIVEAAPGEDVGIPIICYNDDSLSGFIAALKVPEESHVILDSVSWIGSKAEHVVTRKATVTPDSALILALATIGAGEQQISPGTGLLATVWGHVEPPGPPGGEVTLDIIDWDPGRPPRFYTKTEHFWGYGPWYTEFPLDTIRYDDGTPVYSLEYNYGDTVLVWFNPDSVCTLKSVQFLFEDVGQIIFHIWKDPPDSTGELLDDDIVPQPFYVTTNDSTSWTTIDLTPFNIAVEDERGIYIGYELTGTAPYPRILSDSSEADTLHSFCFTLDSAGLGWYPVGTDTTTYDLISQLVVQYTGEQFEPDSTLPTGEEISDPEVERNMNQKAGKSYAVLICCVPALCSGDIRMAFSDFRKHEYAEGDIWVAYGPGHCNLGNDFDGKGAGNDIDGKATTEDINKIFKTWLPSKNLGPDDQVFFYISAHGNAPDPKKSGIVGWKGWFKAWNNLDGKDNEHYYAAVFNDSISKLKCGKVIVVTDFCHDGHFANVLSKGAQPKRVILTATSRKKCSHTFHTVGKKLNDGLAWFDWGKYAISFFSAVCGYEPDTNGYPGWVGTRTVNADLKPDGGAKDKKISMFEAHEYAKIKWKTWTRKNTGEYAQDPQYRDKSNIGKSTFLWENTKKPDAGKGNKNQPKKPKKKKGHREITGVEYEYVVDVVNTSFLPVQKVVKAFAAEDLDTTSNLLVNRRFVAPPIHWEASVIDLENGDKQIVWSLKEEYEDEWGIIAFGYGELGFQYWYDTGDLLGVPQTVQFYNEYDDSLTEFFADTVLESGSVVAQVGLNECMPNPSYGNDEWVELHNWGETSVDLTGWLIAHKDSVLADSFHIIEMIPSIIIPSNGYYSLQLSGDTLLNHRDVLYLLDADSSIVDVVHWDQDNPYEGAAPEGYSLVCDLDGCADSWEWDPNPSPDYSNINPDIEVVALEHQIANAGENVEVDFYVWNTSAVLDSSWVLVSDSLGWTLNPTQLELTLAPDEDSIVSITVTIPTEKAIGRIDWITATATSQSNPSLTDKASLSITAVGLAPFVRGDVNVDGVIDLGDVLYLISYLYKGGTAPDPLWTGDCNCDGLADLGDVLYLISYLYKGGPAPGC